jgi:hypothetical protein
MQPIRLTYTDAPAFIPVPAEFQHHRIEVTLWPLESAETSTSTPRRVTPPQLAGKASDLGDVSNLAGAAEQIRGLEAAQHDAMQHIWGNDNDEVWNHVERL